MTSSVPTPKVEEKNQATAGPSTRLLGPLSSAKILRGPTGHHEKSVTPLMRGASHQDKASCDEDLHKPASFTRVRVRQFFEVPYRLGY